MRIDGRLIAEQRAIAVVRAFEESQQGVLTDVQAGRDPRIGQALEHLRKPVPRPPSADFISERPDGIRIIEVKGRGRSGPIHAIERELETMQAGGATSWLYVVWNTTQIHQPYELMIIRDPSRLPWDLDRTARKGVDQYRGAGDEARYKCSSSTIDSAATKVDLSGLDLPAKD